MRVVNKQMQSEEFCRRLWDLFIAADALSSARVAGKPMRTHLEKLDVATGRVRAMLGESDHDGSPGPGDREPGAVAGS